MYPTHELAGELALLLLGIVGVGVGIGVAAWLAITIASKIASLIMERNAQKRREEQ